MMRASRLFGKMGICAVLVLSVLSGVRPAFAATQSETTDIGIEENRPEQEQAEHTRFHGHVGAEINYAEGILNDSDYRGRLIPLYFVEYDNWVYVSNIGGAEAGVWLWQTPEHTQKFGVSVQRHGGRTDFDTMARRKASADGVVNFQMRTPDHYFIHIDVHHDIGNVSNGDSVGLFLSRNFIFQQALSGHDCMLVPRIDLEWESADLVDYYYGVRPAEATAARPAYKGRETINAGAKLTGFYRINQSWSAFAGVHTAFFGPGIADSPIATRHITTRGYLGAAWLF